MNENKESAYIPKLTLEPTDTAAAMAVAVEPAEEETEEPDLSFLDCLDGLFSSPVEEAKRMLETDGDLCSAAADYWFDMGADTRAVIDALITYAEG